MAGSLSLLLKGFFEGKGERILLKAKNSIPYTKRKSRDCFKGKIFHPNILRIYLLEIFGFLFFPAVLGLGTYTVLYTYLRILKLYFYFMINQSSNCYNGILIGSIAGE